MKKIAFSLVVFFISCGVANADREWAFRDVHVEDVLVYNKDGYNVVTVLMRDDVVSNTGCPPTDTHNIVSYWYKGYLNTTVQIWVSVLLSAQAQDLPVDLWVEMTDCGTSGGWVAFGAPSGLGLSLQGVRISK